jgi:3-dehydroquinate dehydratase
LAAAMLLGAPRVCPAQKKDLKQFVTISFSGYDDLIKGVAMVGKLAGIPNVPQMVEAQLQQVGAAEALNALDKKQPWVVAVKTDAEGNEFAFQGFLPTGDVKKLLKALPMLGEPGDAGDGVLEIKTPDRSIFVKQHGAWAVLSDNKQLVVDAPEDPVKSLGGMQEKYHLGANLSMKSIPEPLRKKFLDIVTSTVQAGLRKMPNESDDQFAARSKMLQQAVEQVKTVVSDMDAITVGIKLDEATSSAYLEYVVTVLPDSASAKKMAAASGAKTEFAGVLLPGAAVVFHATQQLDASDVAQVKSNLAVLRTNAMAELEKQGLPEEQAKLAKQLAGDLMDVLEKTLDSGKMDVAAALNLAPKAVTVVAAAHIAEGGKLESVVKQLVQQIAKDQPDLSKLVKLNAEEHEGIRFHVISIPVSMIEDETGRQKMAALVGESVDVVIGIGEKSLYLAAGRDAAKTLKQAIDGSKSGGQSLPPVEFSVAAGAIARFVAAVADADQKMPAEMVSKMLAGSAGKDHVKLTGTPIPNGMRVRLEVEEGILKTIGVVPMMMGAGKGMMGPPPAVKGAKKAKPAKSEDDDK